MVSLKCWKEGAAGERVVRRSAGSWTSAFVASHIDDIWTVEDRFGIELVTAMEKVDIGRRNADLDDAADAAGEALENLVESGRIRAWGWSTGNVEAAWRMLKFPHFTAVQQGLNVLSDSPEHLALCEQNDLASLDNSPLAMGLLSGNFTADTRLPAGDVRAAGHSWVRDFAEGRPRPEVLAKVAALRDLLTTGGRTLSQGALGWLLARSPKTFPIPGFKNEDQVRDNLGALLLGPLPKSVMADIDRVLASGVEQP